MKQIFIFIFIFAIYIESFSQTKIDRSDDMQIMLWGRKFYVHKVKAGETIYSLSKVYKVPSEQILLINSEEVTNLKTGSLLKIPVVDSTYKPFAISKITFTYHVVGRKESMYAIAKQYNVTQDELIKYNPQVTNGLKKGMRLKIPVKEQTELKGEDELFIYHQLRRGENLQTVAQLYSVDINELKKLNADVKIVEGNVVAVPKKHLSEEQIYLLMHNQNQTPNFFDIDPNYFEDPSYPPCSKFIYNDSMKFRISFLLPLYLQENYDLSVKSLSSNSLAYFGNSQVFYSFLQGSLMAIEKLKEENVNLEIKIYDTNNDSTEISRILHDSFARNSDLIIGPVYSKHYKQIKQFTNQTHINVVSPLSRHESILENNPFVFQAEPGFVEITKFTAKFIAQKIDTSLVFFIANENGTNDSLSDTLKKYIVINSQKPDSLKYQNIIFSKFITPYQNNLSKTKNNIVFIPSTNEIKVAAILNNLNALVTVYNYKITVYAMPAIRYFSKLQIEWLSNLNVHYADKFKNFSDKWGNMEFDKDYKRNFGKNSDNFAYMGYDETYYFVNLLRQYGKYFQFCMNQKSEINNTGKFMEFSFKRTGLRNGFENKKLNMYYYTKDLDIQQEQVPGNYENYFFDN